MFCDALGEGCQFLIGGDYLRELMAAGATRDWRDVLEDAVGEGISARAMLEYFEPLRSYLASLNEGREATLPAL